MGCFNMRCAVTSVPIVVGTPVVMFRVGQHGRKPFSATGDNFVVCSLPRFGEYNDYGDIENETTDPRIHVINDRLGDLAEKMNYITKCDDDRWIDESMFILGNVYDEIVNWIDNSERNGLAGYTIKWRQEAQEKFARRLERHEKLKKFDETESDRLMGDLVMKSAYQEYAREYFYTTNSESYIWGELMEKDLTIGDEYFRWVRPLWHSAHTHHWDLKPSSYGGQDIECDEILRIKQMGIDYVRTLKARFEEDD